MRIIYSETYEQMSRKAANLLSAQVLVKPASVLGLATGSTPLGMYEQLIKWHKKGDIDFCHCRTFNLDEYFGLPSDDCNSYAYYMYENFFRHIDIDLKNTNIPNGTNDQYERECAEYDAKIKQFGGIDIQVLGIGLNGHIGFNEPGDAFILNAGRVALVHSTRSANSRFFGGDIENVPEYAYTLGLRPIVQAKKVLLLANGEQKAEILYKALFGPVTPLVPASILQIVPDLTVCGDKHVLSVIKEFRPDALEL